MIGVITMSHEGHHPLLRTSGSGGWTATLIVAGKTYHHEADYPVTALYNLARELADDLFTLAYGGLEGVHGKPHDMDDQCDCDEFPWHACPVHGQIPAKEAKPKVAVEHDEIARRIGRPDLASDADRYAALNETETTEAPRGG